MSGDLWHHFSDCKVELTVYVFDYDANSMGFNSFLRQHLYNNIKIKRRIKMNNTHECLVEFGLRSTKKQCVKTNFRRTVQQWKHCANQIDHQPMTATNVIWNRDIVRTLKTRNVKRHTLFYTIPNLYLSYSSLTDEQLGMCYFLCSCHNDKLELKANVHKICKVLYSHIIIFLYQMMVKKSW